MTSRSLLCQDIQSTERKISDPAGMPGFIVSYPYNPACYDATTRPKWLPVIFSICYVRRLSVVEKKFHWVINVKRNIAFIILGTWACKTQNFWENKEKSNSCLKLRNIRRPSGKQRVTFYLLLRFEILHWIWQLKRDGQSRRLGRKFYLSMTERIYC